MGMRKFTGQGAGFGMGFGCGFGIGYGFGGASLGFAGLGAGGGCGVGDLSPEFTESKTHRPNVFKQVQYALKRLTTLGAPHADGTTTSTHHS